MIAHIENGTELNGNCENLSTITIKGGKTLILKNNVEIMIPKSERINILNIAHQTHLGQQMMVKQLRRRVFWNKMNLDIDTMVKECDPCQRYYRSHPQEKVEISHASMFDIWHGHSLHKDFCNFKIYC